MTNTTVRAPNAWVPALSLAVMAPVFAEVLPGATRFSSLFVFPIEVAVWGGGAVMARALVRSRGLGWWSLLLLGIALALAEEFLIQQTSVAPMVIRLKGQTWARAFDINYVYLIWAIVYESTWVVLMPTLATELIFHRCRTEPWLGRLGASITAALFAIGAVLAWFTWTRIARTKVFRVAAFTPPIHLVLIAGTAIALLIAIALRRRPPVVTRSARVPRPWLIGILSALWATLWFGLVVLAFGVAPAVSPMIAVASALLICALILALVPRWAVAAGWTITHQYSLLAGGLCGSMAISFVAFQGADPKDLWFKILTNVAALAFLVWLARLCAKIRNGSHLRKATAR